MAQAPTIGRRVYYWPYPDELELDDWSGVYEDCKQPMDAGVLFVHPSGTVNLTVTNWIGETSAVYEVKQTTPEEREPGCWSWVPYQVAPQAKQGDQK